MIPPNIHTETITDVQPTMLIPNNSFLRIQYIAIMTEIKEIVMPKKNMNLSGLSEKEINESRNSKSFLRKLYVVQLL